MSAPVAPAAGRAPARARDAAGQGIVEFGVILAVAAVVAIVVLVLFRPQLAFVLSLIGSEVEKSGWLAGALAGFA
jgi:Flp pilus assembly pilin Flp